MIEKKIEEWIIIHQTWYTTVYELKKFSGIKILFENVFMVPFFYYREFYTFAARQLEMLSEE